MSTPERTTAQVVVAWVIGGAAITFVVVVFGTVLLTGAGTGNFFDPWRALGRVLTTGSTWLATLGGGVVGGVVAAIVAGIQDKRK
ncbi:hypothetical protein ACFQHV_20755 [Promicromonospora thailandica]|uniref:Uncharacterized protein n=1 Tax=Promicromonospora thailandica TaxID=765201 RepID=A0A9X2G8F7_9MICO|nr:hypothetical protein [Promicromonospora thailandica]MCP2267508.1 hypothetical protein [Promicromonospora thailandica]BFF19052.1 hypothetical protein GCM10025730_25730 [Promicromonospora thailandica]